MKRIAMALLLVTLLAQSVAAQWRAEWDNSIAGAEKEGQVTVYGPPGTTYQSAIGAFHETFPKIKLLYVPGSGTNNAQRLVTERRAGKFLADVFIGGSGSLIEVLFDGNYSTHCRRSSCSRKPKIRRLGSVRSTLKPTPRGSMCS